MQIEFSPQRSEHHVGYNFNGEIIEVVLEGTVVETYDFTDVPDGEITEIDQGALPIPAVLRASRVAGELTVVLVLTHDHVDRAPIETRFPNNPYTVAEAEALLATRDAALTKVDEEQFIPPRGRNA